MLYLQESYFLIFICLLLQLQDSANSKPHKKVSNIIKNELKYLNSSEVIVNKSFQVKKCDEATLPMTKSQCTKLQTTVGKDDDEVDEEQDVEREEEDERMDATHNSYEEEETISEMPQKVNQYTSTLHAVANHRVTKSHVKTSKKVRNVRYKNLSTMMLNSKGKAEIEMARFRQDIDAKSLVLQQQIKEIQQIQKLRQSEQLLEKQPLEKEIKPSQDTQDEKQSKQKKQKQQQLEENHQATKSQVEVTRKECSADKLKNNQPTGTKNTTPAKTKVEDTLCSEAVRQNNRWMSRLGMTRNLQKDATVQKLQEKNQEEGEKEKLEREQKIKLEHEKLNENLIEPRSEEEIQPMEYERKRAKRDSKEQKQSKQQQQQQQLQQELKEEPNIEEETKRKLQEHLQKQQQRLQNQQQPLPLVRLKKSQMQNTSLIYPPIAQTSATITPAPSPTNATSPSLTLASSASNNKKTASVAAAAIGVATAPTVATTTSIQTPLTPQSISSVSSGSNSSNNNNTNKRTIANNCTIYSKSRSNSRFLSSLEPYTTRSWEDQEFHCDNEFFLEEADELLADNPSLEIPKWKVIRKSACMDDKGTEPLTDQDFVRRHEKYVRDEIERKKRDARYMREQIRSEALRVRHNQDEVLVPLEPLPISTFYPLPEDIEAISYVTEVPVQAFGENVVNLQAEQTEPNFTLPWLEAVHGETAIARLTAEAVPVATLASKKLPTTAAEARHQEMNSSYVFLKRRKRQRRR